MSPDSRARSAARLVGEPTATSAPTPAATAFWTSSKPARPLTTRHASAGRCPAITRAPVTFSTAFGAPRSGHLVAGFVAPDVLADKQQLAVRGGERRRVHSAGRVEDRLTRAQELG